MAIFNQDIIGIDLGTAATAVYVDGLGVCLREPTQMLVSREDVRQVAAIGEEANRLADRAPEDIIPMPPVRDSAITDIDLAALRLIQQSRYTDGGRFAGFQQPGQVVHGKAGIQNIFHDQDILAFHIAVQILQNPDGSRGIHPGTVGRDSHEIHFHGYINLSGQIRKEDHRSS